MSDVETAHLDALGDADWQRLLRVLLADDHAEPLTRRSDRITDGIGTGTFVYRASGTAARPGRGEVPWSMIIKVLTRLTVAYQTSSDEPTRWDYWKREWHVYRSLWQQALTGPLVAPRCLGTGERPDDAAPLAWIAMADLGPEAGRSWPLSHFTTLARHLGEFNGAHPAVAATRDADPWLSRSWLEGWSEQSRDTFAALPAAQADERGRRVLTRAAVDELTRAWEQRAAILALNAELPHVLSHNDGTPRNVLARDGRSVAVDWGYCGWAPAGQDLSALVVGTQSFLSCPPDEWDDLERLCSDAYLAGLRARSEVDAETLRAGYLTSTTLRFLGLVAPIVELLKPGYEPLVELTWGTSFDRFVDNAAAMVTFYAERIRRARSLLGA